MNVIKSKFKFEVTSYIDFCNVFSIKNTLNEEFDFTDEELIILELNKFKEEKWILNFIDNRHDGYFLIQKL